MKFSDAHARVLYEANLKAVRTTVLKERLLVHELGYGRVLLCAHMGVAVLGQPYPSCNTASEFQSTMLKPQATS
jgi:hypothetical protein